MAIIYTPAQVNAWYQAVQFRDGPQATVQSYVSLLNSAAITPSHAQTAIIEEAFTVVNVNPVVRLYQAAFGRVPDQAGQNAWVDNLAGTPDAQKPAYIQQIAVGFANSQEFFNEYGANASSPINAAVLTAFYANVLNRAPDAAGFNAWLNSGQTVGQVLNGFAQSVEFTAVSNNATVLFQRAEIAGTAPNGVGSLFQFGGFPPSATYTLTTNVETISGSNILVNGLVDFAAGAAPGAATTYQTADTITGVSGTNTLNLTLQNAGAAITSMTTPAITGMSTVNLRNISGQNFFATGGGAYDVGGFGPGVTSINADRSSNAIFLKNVAGSTAIGMIGNGVVTNANIEANYAASATSNTLNVSGGTLGGNIAVAGGGLTTATINSTNSNGSTANTIGTIGLAGTQTTININAAPALTTGAITATGATTYNLSGAGAIDISAGALAATVTKIDASSNTGGVTIALGSNVTQTVTGSQGNDVITTGALVLTTGSVNGGAGSDVLDIGTNVGNVATSALGAKYTNFEALRVNGAVDMANRRYLFRASLCNIYM